MFRFQLFSIITKYIRSFLDLKVSKQIGFCRERTLAGKEGQRRTDSLYQCYMEGGGRGGGPKEGDGGGADV
jgi:hypothetical protein